MEQSSKMALPRKVRLGALRPGRRLPFVLLMQISLLVLARCVLGAFWPEGRNTVPSADSGKTLDLFESRYRSAKALSAVFLEQFSDNGKLVRKEAGRAYFLHPGRMRWDYEAPEKNMFLVDGKYVWFYSPSDHISLIPRYN